MFPTFHLVYRYFNQHAYQLDARLVLFFFACLKEGLTELNLKRKNVVLYYLEILLVLIRCFSHMGFYFNDSVLV